MTPPELALVVPCYNEAARLDPEVRDHDPEVALYGLGPDGLQVPRAVVVTAARLLGPGGLLVMEHADVQQDALRQVLTASGQWDAVEGHPDLTGRPRFVTARRRGAHDRGPGAPGRMGA